MIRYLAVFVFLVATIASPWLPISRSFAAESSVAQDDSYSSFRDRVLVIDKAMGSDFFGTILGYDVLREYRPFNELSSRASDHIDACIEFLSKDNPTVQQSEIAIRSMHLLKLRDYARLARKVFDLYDKGILNYGELISTIFPENSWSSVILENYKDPKIRALLETLAARPDIRPIEKSAIAEILSGEAWKGLQQYRVDCCVLAPRLPTVVPH